MSLPKGEMEKPQKRGEKMEIEIGGERVQIKVHAPGLENALTQIASTVGPIRDAIASFIEPQKKSNP